ncbi:MAG: ABC transporter permease [Clostridia bacterium]|nr:ABC transporter permease [Clostridia bacterium]
MKNVWMIMKKELTRFFTDKRMLISIFLPGILIYLLYTLMGGAMSDAFMTEESYRYSVMICNPSDGVSSLLPSLPVDVVTVEEGELSKAQALVSDGTADLLLVFPAHFDQNVESYVTGEGTAPHVQIYYNSASTSSGEAYSLITSLLGQYESLLANKFDVNADGGMYDLASEEDLTTMMFSMLLPLLLMTFMFSGCMAVAPESIAGEKERGTIATLLVTPMKRSHLAIGKIVSLSLIALSGGVVSFLGVILSLPNLMGDMGGINSAVYGPTDYLLILAIILSTILVFISAISIVSALANSVKEASSYLSVMMVFVMLASISTMFGTAAGEGIAVYLIPVYNSVLGLSGIFNKAYDLSGILTLLLSNLAYAGIMIGILTKMFDSERVMFRR